MNHLKKVIPVILSLILLNCETSVDADHLLDQEQLVIINGYISPQDEILKVQVSRSRSKADSNFSNSEELVINNATVIISDENENEIDLLYTDTSLSYEANAEEFEIIAGGKYYLRVLVDGQEYTSSCEVPSKSLQNIEAEIRESNDPYAFGDKVLRLKIDDIEDERNFYVVGATMIDDSDENFSRTVDFELRQFVTDSNNENTFINVDGFFYSNRNTNDNFKFIIQVTNTDRILYDALKASFFNDYNEGNPFFEPVISPNNIEGENGHGVFAGYQLTEQVLELNNN